MFSPADYFAVTFFGLVVLSRLSQQGLLKSLIMIFLGLILATVGMDIITGGARFTFGILPLLGGIDFVPVAIGLFGISEILITLEDRMATFKNIIQVRLKELFPNKTELKRSAAPVLRGSFLGFFMGLIPGPAAVIASFLSYTIEKAISKRKDEFGKGAPEGLAGPEAANNAAAVGAFMPLLSLGIPFAPPTALLLGALLIHGITPGPFLIRDHPDIFWGVIASMYIGNFLLLVLNLPMVGLFVSILRIPAKTLMPLVLLLCIVGSFAVNNSVMDVGIVVIAGIAGYILRKLDFPIAPLVIALVIGPMLENYLRQAMIFSVGDYRIFIESPISATFLTIALLFVLSPLLLRSLKLLFARLTG
jgi:putative tricarboxylic transport membrane protein